MGARRAGASRRARGALALLVAAAGSVAPAAAGAGGPGAAPRAHAPGRVLVHYQGRPGERVLEVGPGRSVSETVRELRRDPAVDYANPDYVVTAAGSCAAFPNDPGHGGARCWRDDQWNFLEPAAVPGGVNGPGAWKHLSAIGRRGGRGTTVAVLDTGVAYRRHGRRFRRDPDLPAARRFVHPLDLVDGDRLPLDEEGHGTHVASTIAQRTNNRLGLTGLAYGAKVMPIRVLNSREHGTGADVARGVRFAVRHGADVVNLSLTYNPTVTHCAQIVAVCRAIRHAVAKGVVVVAAAGNDRASRVAYPAAAPGAIAVGATTVRGCLAEYSDYGAGLDLVAPGGGKDAAVGGNPACDPTAAPSAIRQFSLRPRAAARDDFRRFGIVSMHGTSMAAAHASAAAALVLTAGYPASKVEGRLEGCARQVSVLPDQFHYGAGLLDAARADSQSSC